MKVSIHYDFPDRTLQNTHYILCKKSLQLANANQQRHVMVVLLTGQKLDVTCDVNSVGKDLMEVVNTQVGLHEHYYFGLSFLQGQFLFHGQYLSIQF